jgi:hypothetical protein
MGLLDNNTGSQTGGLGVGGTGSDGQANQADYTSSPSYLVGSDAHNYGNSNFAITDPSTWGEAPSDITKFIVGSAVSGLTSIYNSGVTVSNWLGGNNEEANTADVLSGIDDDLSQYYKQHQTGEDLLGFVATSLLPGTAGIKVLNAGQKMLGAVELGGMGANMARATGLLPDAAEMFARASANEIASSGAQISALNSNSLKALAAGVGQNILEGAAFTTAVQATMFKSPMLDQQDGWDIAQNILTGGLLQGAIGGAFTAAKVLGIAKRGVTAADEVLAPSTFINEPPATASASDRVVQRLDDIANTPQFQSLDDFTKYMSAVNPNASDLDAQALYNRFQANVANRSVRLQNLMQQDIHELTGGDADLTQQLLHTLTATDPAQAAGNMEQMLETGRISTSLKTEDQILARAAGKGFLEPLDENAPVAAGNKSIQYVKLFGDDAGSQVAAKPQVEATSLADRFQDVAGKVASYGFGPNMDFASVAAKDLDQADARYIWAKTQKIQPGQQINSTDLPLMEQAYVQRVPVNLREADGSLSSVGTPGDMLQRLRQEKSDQAAALLQSGKNTDYIAKATNVSRDSLEHTQSADPTQDLLARQTLASQYTRDLIQRGLWTENKGAYDLDSKPSWAKVAYSTKAYKDADGNVVSGMGRITAMQKVAQTSYDNVFAKGVGDQSLVDRFIPIPKQTLLKANRFGSGPGFIRFANGTYGSLASLTENIGKATSDLQKLLKDNVGTRMDGPLYALGSKPQAAIEFSAINREIAATTEKYVLGEDANGSPQLISRSWKRYQDAIAAGKDADAPQIQPGARIQIPIGNAETADAIRAHIETNGDRLTTLKEIHAAQGLEDSKDSDTFYPLKPNPKDYPHFAFVVDPTITGAGHISMIHATSPSDLDSLIQKVPAPYRVITKAQSEEFHQTIGDYQWDRTLHENYIDSEIASKGINSQFFPSTDPAKIVSDLKDFHLRQSDVLARELVNMKYQTEFSEVRRLADQWDINNASRYGSANAVTETTAANPYTSYIKSALNISRASEFPLWQGLNTVLDKNVSAAWNTISGIFRAAKSPEDLDAVNSALQSYGLKSAYQDAATYALANKSPNAGVLRNFIGRANSLLATLTLRLDPLNSVNYAIGHQVLNGTEFISLLRAIRAGNSDIAGALAQLQNVKLPQVQDFIRSPGKLIANAIKNFVDEAGAKTAEGKILSDFYRENGWIKDAPAQFRSMLDDLTINGEETSKVLQQRLSAAMEKARGLAETGATLSGSKLSEQFQGFLAADVMRQITDIGQNAGVIGPGEARAYINTFVNRVRGNMLASQRPVMFQGPIGQAIGLFQTYQFNILQQLLRHVAEGSGKDVATLLGLQGTIYGMQSLPAFNFINQHIVGTASGNPMHRDLYDATYGILGKTAGDFLMYGLPSNLLRTNLYSRGDLNPRNMTVIPTSLSDIPIVNSWGRFFGNLKDTAQKVAQGGGVWESLLSGLEHNAISRPLAGLAQTLQASTTNGTAYSTSTKGNILGANDLASIATLARIAGGRPLDEAIQNDATYRVAAYQAADVDAQEKLGESLKTTLRAGEQPTQDQVNQFSHEYAAAGGNQRNFSKWMFKQMVTANTSQANRLAGNLNSKYSQGMQTIMGGGYALDGTRIDPVSGLSYSSENPSVQGE